MNERTLNEGQWEDRKQWSLGIGQRRKTFWNRYMYVCIYVCMYVCVYIYIYIWDILLTQVRCQVAHTTWFWHTLMICCAYSWISTVFLEILSFLFDSPSVAANYVVQLWCTARVWRSYQVWWELVNWSKRWHMPNWEPMTVLSYPAKYQHYWWCLT
jgi:hypothetical protein